MRLFHVLNVIITARYLSHLFSVSFGVEWSFCQQNWMFFRRYSQLVVEGVMPDLGAEGKKSSLLKGLILMFVRN